MNKPRVGSIGTYRSPFDGLQTFVVVRVDGNLCYARYGDDKDAQPFIWRHKDGLNSLHDWPGKNDANGDLFLDAGAESEA